MAKVKEAPPEQVRETYRLHDERESNPASREMFAGNTPQLDEQQQHVVDALEQDGFCVVRVAELFSPETWDEVSADAETYTREIEPELEARAAKIAKKAEKAKAKPGKPKPGKEGKKEKFLMGRRFKKTPLTLDNPWLQLGASTRMLDIINTYLGMWAKLTYADQWYTPPRGSEADRLGSMRWHRDYNDQHLVKVFTYLVDVDEGTGPFEYVPGSARGGPYSEEWPWQPAGETYPPQDEFEQRIPQDAVETFTAPAGSMIFCNTSGFHRGGFATENPRNLFVYNYVSPAGLEALVDRNFDIGDPPPDLSEVQRFALT